MRRFSLSQLARHFTWWYIALVVLPFIVIFTSVIVPSEIMTHIAFVLLLYVGYPAAVVLGHPIFDPALKMIPTGAPPILICFFFNDTATTEIYTLSLHYALPI